jgi:hypothetical protein
VQGSARAYEAACEAFLVAGRALKETVSHVSDQELLRAGCVEFEIRADVPTFGASGWESAFAIHYKTDSLKGLKGTKSERIAAAAPTLPQTSRAPGGYDLNHEIEQNRAHGPNVKPCVCVFSGSAPPRQLREIRHPLVPSDNFN